MIYAKHTIKRYKDNTVWADNAIAQDFRKLLDTEEIRRYTGRRIFALQNTGRLREIMRKAEFIGKPSRHAT